MKKLFCILLLAISFSTYSQSVTQTYYDKCTGETKVYVIPMIGSTIVTYYNKSMVVTFADIQSGAFQAWLEATYIWWSSYNPCSAAQATQTVVTQTTQAATTAAINVPIPSSTPTPAPAPAVETKATVTETKTETKSETKTETKQEEKKEESKSESKKEEKKEEKKEDKKEEKKKQQAAQPVLIAANYMTMQNLDGTFNQVASFGLSQSSLTGETSYGANAMIWSNLKQFSLSLSKTTVLFNHDKKVSVKVQGFEFGHYYTKGSIYKITGLSVTAMIMFNTKVISLGMNDVFLLKKGLVFGYALGTTFINMEENLMVSPSFTLFATRPFPFNRITLSPMLASSFSPMSYSTETHIFVLNKHFTYILGSNFDFNLTKRFKANIGVNSVGNTDNNIPMTYAITIGSKFKF